MIVLAVVVLAAQVAAVPAAGEAERLGRQVAETGTLASLLPLLAAKDTDELIAQHPELTPAEQAALRRTAATTLDAAKARLFGAEAKAYAAALTLAELRAMVAWQTGPTAARLRMAQPKAIAAAMGAMQGFDLKKETWAAFCSGRASCK